MSYASFCAIEKSGRRYNDNVALTMLLDQGIPLFVRGTEMI